MIPNSPFDIVSKMNVAFNNPKGDPLNINWERVKNQTLNVFDETAEAFAAMGMSTDSIEAVKAKIADLKAFIHANVNLHSVDSLKVRDALCDIPVFSHGAQHIMGIDGDLDIATVIVGVMTRFIKDDADKAATIAKHAAKGVTDVYFEGEYPTMTMKSASEQPDAPKGKFLKSASYQEPVFYDPAFYSYTQHFDLTELPVTYWQPREGQSHRGWVHQDDLASWLMGKGYCLKLDPDNGQLSLKDSEKTKNDLESLVTDVLYVNTGHHGTRNEAFQWHGTLGADDKSTKITLVAEGTSTTEHANDTSFKL